MLLTLQATTPCWGPERTMLEEWAVLQLQRLHYLNRGYARFVGYYNGELDTEQGALDLMNHIATEGLPGILVSTGEAVYHPKSTAARHFDEDINLEVIFASGHIRSFPSRLRGDIASGPDDQDENTYPLEDPGIYRMMRDTRSIFLSVAPEIEGMSRLKILRESVVLQTPEVTLWRAVYGAGYHWAQVTREQRTPNAAETIEIQYKLNEDFSIEDEAIVNPVIVVERSR